MTPICSLGPAWMEKKGEKNMSEELNLGIEEVKATAAKKPATKKAATATAPKKPASKKAVKAEAQDALAQLSKEEIVKAYGKNEKDTGSAAVQIALLTQRINHLTNHLKEHKQDKHSRRGLMQMVGQRKGLMTYMEKTDVAAYRELKEKLGLR